MRLLDDYKIRTVTTPRAIYLTQDSRTDVLSFVYIYATEEGPEISIEYRLSNYWIDFREGELNIPIDERVLQLMTIEAREKTGSKVMRQKQYAALFHKKTEAYFKKTNRIMLGDSIITKVIRMTADNLNQKEQIVLNKSTLLSCETDDLLK